MAPDGNQEEKTKQEWYKLGKALFVLRDILIPYVKQKMRVYHSRKIQNCPVPCKACHGHMREKQCENCKSWKELCEKSIRAKPKPYNLPWGSKKKNFDLRVRESYENFEKFTILFTDFRYMEHSRLEDVDAVGLVLIMEHCKEFERISLEACEEVIFKYMSLSSNHEYPIRSL